MHCVAGGCARVWHIEACSGSLQLAQLWGLCHACSVRMLLKIASVSYQLSI